MTVTIETERAARSDLAAAAARVQRKLSRYPAELENAGEAERARARAKLAGALEGAAAMADATTVLRELNAVSEEAIEIAAAAGVAVEVVMATLANLTAQLDCLDAAAA